MIHRLRTFVTCLSVLAAGVLAPTSAAVADEQRTIEAPRFLAWLEGRRPTIEPVGRTQRLGGVCQGCDLSDQKLTGVVAAGDFSRASFVRAVMVRMNGEGSTFADADFSLANLTSGRLMDADCDRARFSGARFGSVDASRAALEEADFSNAEAQDAVFTQAMLVRAKFIGAKAPRANFLRADLQGASFAFARLEEADFTQADLRGADFSHAVLSGANFGDARNLDRTKFVGACGDAQTKLPRGMSRLPECG